MSKSVLPKSFHGPTILLQSGAYFDLMDPAGSDFTIEDIAHALSQICRFTGHTSVFYSVAEHSVHCSFLTRPEDRYAALMHDAAEAFIGDVSRPLKRMLPDYKAFEESISAAIFERFGVPNPLPKSVEVADLLMLKAEKARFFRNHDDWECLECLQGIEPPLTVQCSRMGWTHSEARLAFLGRYYQLRGDQ